MRFVIWLEASEEGEGLMPLKEWINIFYKIRDSY